VKVYSVGGAVRDELLGLPVQDRDYVVVGATAQELTDLGYRPVGRDFPVFLHPLTHEEYALARTERKVSPGYHGFAVHAAPDVTLEQDLERRDLTINAMARGEDGVLIDPFGGARDLAAGILRHVGPAFVEDPVRILRLARFAARFRFAIAPETLALMRTMVAAGEVDALVAERVWQELARGLMETTPSAMFEALRACGALVRILPEVDALFGVQRGGDGAPEIDCGLHAMRSVDTAARAGHDLAVRFAALVHELGKTTTPRERWPDHGGHRERGADMVDALCARLRVPAECRDLSVMAARLNDAIHEATTLPATGLVAILQQADALRRPDRFERLLDASESDFHARRGFEAAAYPPRALLAGARDAAAAVPAREIAARHPTDVAAALERARIEAVAAWLAQRSDDGTGAAT